MDSPSVGNSSNLVNLKERVERAARVMYIPVETLWLYLGHLGIERDHEDGLALLEADTTQEGDARRIMVEEGVEKVGIARFKAGWAVLKGKTEAAKTTDTGSQILSFLKTAEHMSDKELIEQYGPECTSNICEELKRRSNDRSFVIFLDNDGKVDVDNSLKLLRTARRQEISSTFSINGKTVVKTYRIGEFPMLFLEECPFHSDTILVNGYCEQCRGNWEDVAPDTRVMARVALDTGHLKINNFTFSDFGKLIDDLGHANLTKITESPGFKQEYEDLKQENRLPVLRRKLSNDNNKTGQVYVQRRSY